MLTAAEIAAMQVVVESAMPSSASFQRRASTKNAAGGRDNALAAVSGMGAVPCHVHPDTQRGMNEGDAGRALHASERYRLIFPEGTDVRDQDVVTVNDGGVFEIVQVDVDRSWALEVEALGVRRG